MPYPGTATEADLLKPPGEREGLCELVDGVLVEKAAGILEPRVASLIQHHIESYLDEQDIGAVLAPDGLFRLRVGLVRLPDVSFVS